MLLTSPTKTSAGFTLVEVVIVAPLVILIIGALIAMAVTLTGASMRTTARGQLQYDVLSALDQIEQDIKLSTHVVEASTDSLRLRNIATDRNPLQVDRQLVSLQCTPAVVGVTAYNALTYMTNYRIQDGTLQRQIDFDKGCQGHSSVWQRHGSVERLVRSTSRLRLETSADSKGAVTVTLTGWRVVAGEEVSFTGYLYARSLNVKPTGH